MGQSMGGMLTWVMGESYPDFMDGLVPLQLFAPVLISVRVPAAGSRASVGSMPPRSCFVSNPLLRSYRWV